MSISGEDISVSFNEGDAIESFIGSLFSPQIALRMMNRGNNGEGNTTNTRQNLGRFSYRNRVGSSSSNPHRIARVQTLLPGLSINRDEYIPVSSLFNNRMNRNIAVPLNALLSVISGRNGGGAPGDILQNSMNDTGGVLKKASPEFIKTLCPPKEVPEECICGVCQDEVTSDDIDNLLELPCGHIYNKECILEWFKKNCSCPICREEFDSIEVSLRPTSESGEGEGADEGVDEGADEGVDDADDISGETIAREREGEELDEGEDFSMQVTDMFIDTVRNTLSDIENTISDIEGTQSSAMDEETILQEAILRSIRDV